MLKSDRCAAASLSRRCNRFEDTRRKAVAVYFGGRQMYAEAPSRKQRKTPSVKHRKNRRLTDASMPRLKLDDGPGLTTLCVFVGSSEAEIISCPTGSTTLFAIGDDKG